MTDKFDHQFRQRAGELQRSPRPQAWQRLEHRLEHRARRRRTGFYRLLSIAAGVLILVCVTWALTQSAYQEVRPAQFADVQPVTPDAVIAVQDAEAVVTYRHRARKYYDSPIVEGDRSKQLVVVGSDGQKRVPNIARAPATNRLERVSRLRVRPSSEWE